jgi:DASS family divalent anion:Na+ symporter
MEKTSVDMKKIVGLVLGLAIAVIFSFFPTAEPLQPKAWLSVGLLVCAVVWMISGALRDYQAMIVVCCLLVVTKCATFAVVFAPFGQSAFWMLFGALGIGVAAVECGFMRRVAYLMLKALPSSYMGQALAYVISGAIISPIVPSTTAKGVIMAPLAKNTSDALGMKSHSKGAIGMYMAFFTGYVCIAYATLSGSSVNIAVLGALPDDQKVTWMGWFTALLPWTIVSTVLTVVVIKMFFAPKKGEGDVVSKAEIQAELDKMGPWTRNEKITLGVLICALIMWIFETQTGVSATITALIAFVILFGVGVVPPSKLKNIAWEPLFFVGAFLCLPTIFNEVGLNAYLALMLGDRVAPLMNNVYLLVLFISILTYLMRLVFISLSGTAVLVTAIFIPFCAQYGVHPFVVASICYMSTNTWNVAYQNTVTIAALAANGPDWLTQKDITIGSMWYMVTNIIGLLACVPFWQLTGMI